MSPATPDAAALLDTTPPTVAVGSLPRACPICGSDTRYQGATTLEMHGPPHLAADAWRCTRCAAVSTVPIAR